MAIYVIADLHLDTKSNQKSMEVFGNRWKDYVNKIQKNWQKLIQENDTVIIPGDISWALNLKEALDDLKWIDALPGKKILLKGNHDFWWSTASKIHQFLYENCITSIDILNNTAFEVENYIIAGSRGWFTDQSMQNTSQKIEYSKIVNRETIRLRMSLDRAQKLQETSKKEILVFLHFPPVWGNFRCEEILALLREFHVTRCYFGHIHSTYAIPCVFWDDAIRFQMISADYLDFIPQFVG
ncbi:MAG: serine/threonine protein phosphatase [Ruminococcaceae bacterium]|nr:serine/threonine protein phosphatase [Oscillospiraceae bacterium]